jgi:anaerobic magnesium-protoporphyrin IX monomethyl ester cyclase
MPKSTLKICLVRASLGSSFAVSPPLSLGYLSSALKANGYEQVSFLDCARTGLNPQQATDRITQQIRPDIVGIQVYTGSHAWTKAFIADLKKRSQKTVTVVGGPHITALKEMALDYLEADFGVIGEGEDALIELLKYVEGAIADPADVTGLLYKKAGRYVQASKGVGFLKDIDRLPYPDWSLLRPKLYFDSLESATMPLKGQKAAIMLSSRGCPYRCSFCASGLINKSRIRFRAPENIINEMKFLKSTYGVDEIMFTDDNLTMDLKRAETIFDLMAQEKLNLFWRAPNGIRIDRLNKQLIEKMAASGCYSVGVGIETGNAEIMQRIKKNLDLTKVKKAVKLLQKNNIAVSGFFMCGMLGETAKEIEDSINFACSVPFARIQVSNFTPYPGSADFLEIFNHTNKDKYRRYVMRFQEKGIIPPHPEMLPMKTAIGLQRKFILKFYLRPALIFSMLSGLTLKQLKAIFKHPMIRRMLGFKADLYSKPTSRNE